MRSHIVAVGHYLPEKVMTNHDLPVHLDTSDQWIRERTGISQRHIAAEGQLTSHLAAEAAKNTLKQASIDADTIDLILVATTTPDETFPATAVRVQALIGADNASALDIQAACSGFVYGLSLADGMIQSGQAHRVLVIGAETYSRIVDWQDRGTCILFGDGAGAVLLEASDSQEKTGILASKIYADGKKADILKTTGGVSLNQQAGVVKMQGREVFRHAVAAMSNATLEAAKQADIPLEAIDWLIPHQANARIVDSIAEKLDFPREKVIATMDKHANTSAASIPLAWSCAVQDGRIKPGEILALPALGAGLTWGCCIIKY